MNELQHVSHSVILINKIFLWQFRNQEEILLSGYCVWNYVMLMLVKPDFYQSPKRMVIINIRLKIFQKLPTRWPLENNATYIILCDVLLCVVY